MCVYSLFSELPRRVLLGNRASDITPSRNCAPTATASGSYPDKELTSKELTSRQPASKEPTSRELTS